MTDNKMKLDADGQHLCTGHELLGDILTKQDILTVAQRVTGDKSISVLNYHFSSFSQQVLGMLGSHNNLAITVRVSKFIVLYCVEVCNNLLFNLSVSFYDPLF